MKTPYTFTILRYMHDTVTGEFVNVGVALYAPDVRYASGLCRTTYSRLAKVFPGMNGDSFKSLMRYIQSRLEEIGDSLRDDLPFNGPNDALALAQSILPPDDSSLQWSALGSGITGDPSKTLEQLFNRLVMQYDERKTAERKTDDEVWRKYRQPLERRHVLKHLQPKTISVRDDEVEFPYTWKNGVWHCLAPLSLDLATADGIRDKAHRWLGQLTSVREAPESFKVYLLLGEPQQQLSGAVDKAVSILEKIQVEKEIVRESMADEFSERFANEIEKHQNH
jgi:hypothetical protein